MSKPNVIFLIQDQMQQQVLQPESSCLMPNLKKMAEDGISFSRAYTCNAICSPARASFLTGTLPHIHGMVDCTHTVPEYRAEFDDNLDTLTQAFHDTGYHVSYFGKWHIERSHELERFGVDTYKTEKHIPGFHVTVEDQVVLKTPGYEDKMVCGIFSEGVEKTEEHYIYQEVIKDIEEHGADGRPFCTFISTYAPHDPYCVPKEIYDLYEDADLKLSENFLDSMEDKPAVYRRMRDVLSVLSESDFLKAKRCYYSYCTLVDQQVGRLIQYLKEKNLYDNTLIVCMSDHGDMMGAHGLMMKSVEPFEEIYHIPLLMKLPEQESAGMKADFYINTYEIAPTVLELAGVRGLRGKHVGISMAPWIRGEKKDNHYAFAEFFGQRYAYTQRIYWEDDMKYVFNAFDEDELYDLKRDPFEMTNLNHNAWYQEKKKNLCAKMWERIKDTEDFCLADAEYYLMRFAPVGPGEKKQNGEYSIYNKKF